jgi:hypothetical protein
VTGRKTSLTTRGVRKYCILVPNGFCGPSRCTIPSVYARLDPLWNRAFSAPKKLLANKGEAAARLALALTRLYASRAFERVELSSRKVIAAVAEGDMLRTQMAILRRLGKHEPGKTVAWGRHMAGHVIQTGRYSL